MSAHVDEVEMGIPFDDSTSPLFRALYYPLTAYSIFARRLCRLGCNPRKQFSWFWPSRMGALGRR